MSFWRHLTHGLRRMRDRKTSDQDIADEVEHFLEQATAASVERGLSPEDARRTARMELGSATAVREEMRTFGWENAVETLFADFRFAVRRLRNNPGFAAAGILTLALGIGATTAIFSVVNGVLLKPLPYPNPEQLVALRHTAPGIDILDLNMSPSVYFTYKEESRVFQDVSLSSTAGATVTGVAEPEEVPVLFVTHRLLPMLGVKPALGRNFLPSDDTSDSSRTVMLSDSYWKSRFGGDRSVVGRRIMVDGNANEIVGVLPASFEFMDRKNSLLMPFRFDRNALRLGNFSFRGIARLRQGATLEQATADIHRMIPIANRSFPPPTGLSVKIFEDARISPNLQFLKDDLVGDISQRLWVLLGAVGILLLMACANIANLLLVRVDGRHQELAVRAALGAGRGRIARELLMESLVLGLAGGAAGIALAYQGLQLLARFEPVGLPRLQNTAIDLPVLAFALSLSLAASFVFGSAPIWKYSRPQLSSALRGGGRTLGLSKERRSTRSVLVIIQVMLALILLVGSGLMIRTFLALRNVDPGFSGAEQLQTLRMTIPEAQVKEPTQVFRMQHSILERIAAISGVSSVAAMNAVPLNGGPGDPIYAEDRVYSGDTVATARRFKFISPGYLRTMGSRLIAGREFTWDELYKERRVALVSENLARELWSDPRTAVGKRIRSMPNDDWFEVIGVVQDLRDDGVDRKAPAMVYWPLLQKRREDTPPGIRRSVAFVVRTPRAGTAALAQEIQQAVGLVNAEAPLANVRTLREIYDRSLARTSFTLVLLTIAGGMALFLGIIGIYGVIAYSVTQRTREIGIRLALGARREGVSRMFVRQGLALSAIGSVCGLGGAFALTHLMNSLLFDVSPADPLTYVVALLALISAAMLASYLPARKAAKVDPMLALRTE